MSEQSVSEQIITYKPYMLGLLGRLQKARANVRIKINKEPQDFSSIVLDIQAEQKILLLDELTPESGHQLLKKGSLIHLDARLRGVQVNFQSQVMAIETENNIPLYKVALPEQLTYKQRRRHFRAMVQDDEQLAISFPLSLRRRATGNVVDISASGFCSRMTFDDSALLEERQQISGATIDLPGRRNQIICDVEVRSIRHFPEKGFSLIGSEITEIAPNHKNHVERLVAMLDRHQRRNHYL